MIMRYWRKVWKNCPRKLLVSYYEIHVSQPIVVSLSLNIQIQKSLLVNDKFYENLFILHPKLNDFSLSFLENLRLLLVG